MIDRGDRVRVEWPARKDYHNEEGLVLCLVGPPDARTHAVVLGPGLAQPLIPLIRLKKLEKEDVA